VSNCVGGDGDFAADGVFHGLEVVGDGVDGEAFLAGLEGGAVGCLDGGHVSHGPSGSRTKRHSTHRKHDCANQSESAHGRNTVDFTASRPTSVIFARRRWR